MSVVGPVIVGGNEKAFFEATGVSRGEEGINAGFGDGCVFGVELALDRGETAAVGECGDQVNAGVFGIDGVIGV